VLPSEKGFRRALGGSPCIRSQSVLFDNSPIRGAAKMMELGTFSTLYGILAVCFVSPPPAFVNLGLTVQVGET
jgi:hypothetical protein